MRIILAGPVLGLIEVAFWIFSQLTFDLKTQKRSRALADDMSMGRAKSLIQHDE
jgi:hypothetical protein